MASHRISTHNGSARLGVRGGFTLCEALIVLGILAVVGTLALGMSFDEYRGDMTRAERATLVAVLQRARSQAMSNVCRGDACTGGQSHGVHMDPDTYVLFQGRYFDPGDPANETIPHVTKSVAVSGGDVLFSPLSATTTPEVILITAPTGRTLPVTIGSEGQIF